MQRKTRSLLEELEAISESRAHNIITSAINLLEMINKNYDSERAAILERKLLIAIKNKDQTKFSNSLKKQNKVEKNSDEKSTDSEQENNPD